MSEVSTFRLYLMRGTYPLILVGSDPNGRRTAKCGHRLFFEIGKMNVCSTPDN